MQCAGGRQQRRDLRPRRYLHRSMHRALHREFQLRRRLQSNLPHWRSPIGTGQQHHYLWVVCSPGRPPNPGYTSGMKTAISLPDEVFENAEKLASRLNVSRSELYARALQDFVRQHDPDSVTEAYNQVCSELEVESGDFIRHAARATFKRTE
jgi:hypothetical protein